MLGQEVMTSYVRSCSTNSADWRSIVSGRVSLLFGVCFSIAGSLLVFIIGVYGYLGAIYSCTGVKVTQGHEGHGPST